MLQIYNQETWAEIGTTQCVHIQQTSVQNERNFLTNILKKLTFSKVSTFFFYVYKAFSSSFVHFLYHIP